MKYSALHKSFIISPTELERVSVHLLYVMKRARIMAKQPLGKRKSKGGLTELDHLERAVLSVAKEIGIDFGHEWGEEIDLTDFEDG